MSWIKDAIASRAADILSGVDRLLADGGSRGGPEEMEQAQFTLELMIPVIDGGSRALLLDRWSEVGRTYASRDLAMAELTNTPDLLKRACWTVLEGEVEAGSVTLEELVAAMMQVEAVLGDCWLAQVKGYLGARDVQLAASNARLESLYSLTEVLASESDDSKLYRAMVNQAASITGLARCSLLLFDEQGSLVPAASNLSDAMEKLRRSSGDELDVLGSVVKLSGPVVLTRGAGLPHEIDHVLEHYHTPTVLLVPLTSGEREIGLLLLDEERAGEFNPEQIALAVATANQAALAIEKGGLVEELERRLKHLAAIGIVARTLDAHSDPKEQLGSVLEMACTLLHADRGMILLVEEMFGELKEAARRGERSIDGDELIEKAARWALEHGEVVVLRKGVKDPRFGGALSNAELCVFAALPVHDKAIGVICVASDRKGRRFDREDLELFGNFAAQAAVSVENTQLYDRVQGTYLGAIGALAAAIEARDPYTVGHSARVTQYAAAIAESMGLPADEVEELRLAGILHDLGKIGIPDSILNKPGRLSEEEYMAMKMHPQLSMRIIEPLPGLGNILPIIYHHHEHFDGGGYVDGKAGEDIPQGARIIAVADSYEAMTSDRPYRTALTREQAMAELQRCSGSQFDPVVVRHFLALLKDTATD